MPSFRQSLSSTYAPPIGTDDTNSQPAGAVTASASPGSSSRDSDATSRVTASRSSSSSRPKLYSTLVRDRCVSLSHSLWASCR